jgi:L-aspartate oxidase
LHGGNRLASNSLLEAVVFGARVAADIRAYLPHDRVGHFVHPRRVPGHRATAAEKRRESLDQLRAIMTKHVGVQRSAKGLKTALAALKDLDDAAADDTVLSNMILTARLIAAAALMRKESRGGHYRTDYPAADPALAERTFITIDDLGALEPALRPTRSISAMACRP